MKTKKESFEFLRMVEQIRYLTAQARNQLYMIPYPPVPPFVSWALWCNGSMSMYSQTVHLKAEMIVLWTYWQYIPLLYVFLFHFGMKKGFCWSVKSNPTSTRCWLGNANGEMAIQQWKGQRKPARFNGWISAPPRYGNQGESTLKQLGRWSSQAL